MNNPEKDIFSDIFYTKKLILMVQNLKNSKFATDEIFNKFRATFKDDPDTMSMLEYRLTDYTNILRENIPDDVYEDWRYCDYTVYTDKFYHRKFFNEIENDIAIEYFLEIAFKLLNISTSADDSLKHNLRLYDFNDYDIYFATEEDMMSFFDEYTLETSTYFLLDENNSYVEQWSV